jgi:hypothetical protein
MKTLLPVVCANCGTLVSKPPKAKNQPPWKYCSYSCAQVARRIPLVERLGKTTDKSGGPASCWIWTGVVDGQGYGNAYVNINGRKTTQKAHRVWYEAIIGPIAYGLVIDHLCRNPTCVNPAHLEPVTNRINVLRGVGRAARNVAKTTCIHGHPLEGSNLRLEIKPGASQPWRRCVACSLVPKRPDRSLAQ